MLAIRLHPLAPRRRHRGGDPQLARRSLPLPADLHRLPPRGRPRRGGQFHRHVARYGLPVSTLTDNGSVYTLRFTHGHNEFELLLGALGVTQKNGHPGHPQPKAKWNASTKPSNAGWHHDPNPPPGRDANPARHLPDHRQHRAPPPAPHHTRAGLQPLPKPPRPASSPTCTSACATTPSTNSANSPCATPAASATSVPVAPTPTPKSTSSSPQQPSPSLHNPTTRSSPPTTSTPTAATGETRTKAPADGRGKL